MAHNYTECNRDQLYLLPLSMKEWLPEDHLAWFLIDAVGQMDLSAFHAAHRNDGRGQKAHHPEMMLAVLLYAYCQGERSSRKIERLCQESVPYRIVAADTTPDHCAFARFRQRHAKAMKSLFVEILRLCAEAGLVKAGKVNLDGTKMKANASLAANRTEKGLSEEIERMLAEAEAKDTEEDETFGKNKRGDELPEGLRTRESRRMRLQEARERLEQERREAEEAQRRKLEERARKEEESGKKMRGRPPRSVEAVGQEQGEAQGQHDCAGDTNSEDALRVHTGAQCAGGMHGRTDYSSGGRNGSGERPGTLSSDDGAGAGECDGGAGRGRGKDQPGPCRCGLLQRSRPGKGMRPRDSDGDEEGLETTQADARRTAAARSDSEESIRDGTDGAQAQDKARKQGVQETVADHRAHLRSDQERARNRRVLWQGTCLRARRVEPDLWHE